MAEFRLALSYLRGRPIRSGMTVLSIVIGVMMMFGLNGMAPAFMELFISSTSSMSLSDVDLYFTRRDGSFFQESYQRNVASVKGVESTASMIVRSVAVPSGQYYTSQGREITSIQVFGVDTSSNDPAFNIVTAGGRRLKAGRYLQAGDRRGVLISEEFAAGLKIGVGDTVKLPGAGGWMNFQVLGLLDAPGLMLGSQQVFMTISAAQDFLNTPNRINTIMGRYSEGVDARAVDAAILSMFSRGYALAPMEGGADIWAALMEFTDVIFTMFGLLALAMAGLIMFNTFRTSVVERRRDIGMLRAVGARRKSVMRIVLYEGLILAGFGTVAGILLGFGFAYGAKAGLASMMENFMGQPLGSLHFTLSTFIVSILFGMGVPLASIILPARSASAITPLEAMRPATIAQEEAVIRIRTIIGAVSLGLGVAGLVSGYFPLMAIGILLFLLALGLLGPLLIRPITTFFSRALVLVFGQEGGLAAGNISRQPRRAAITATSLMISLAILVGLGGMLASVYGGALRYLDATFRTDYLMMSGLIVTNDTMGAGSELMQTAKRVPGVEDVTTMRQIDLLDENNAGFRIVGIDPLKYEEMSGLSFHKGNASVYAQMKDGSTVIVNGRYASQFGIEVGDVLTLAGDHGPLQVKVGAVGLDYLNVKLPTIYMDQTSLTREYGVRNDVFVLVNAKPGANRKQLEEDLQTVARSFPGFGIISREELRNSQEKVARGGTIGMSIVLSLLAAPSLLGLANALSVNVIERTREIGMLRAIGARRSQVKRMVVAESLLLSLMGIALGVISGILLSFVMTAVLEFAGMHIPYSFPGAGVITAIAAGLICGILAAFIPARRASDLEIVSALAYE